ncbi:MAG: hypothetical protein JEZ03_02300 [Bacteroidales bacterium]|nr:hypothetical protein [Bacteroidales bacterium]
MKKIILSIIVLAIASLGMYSCKKDQMQTNQNQTEQQINAEDMALIQKIEAFKASLNQKSTLSLGVDDALWNIEAAMNYTYGAAEIALNDVDHYKFIIEVPTDANGLIEMEDVSNAYNEVLAQVSGHYHSIEADEKNLLMVDLTLFVEEEKGLKSSPSVKYEVTSAVNSTKSTTTIGFDETDYWYYGQGNNNNNGGYCDGPYQGLSTNSDAAEEIQKKINKYKAVPTTGRYWYSETEEVPTFAFDYPNPNDQIPGDNIQDYLMFHSTSWASTFTCINPTNMNFYLNGTKYIVYHYNNETIPGARPEGKHFISIDVVPEIAMLGQGYPLHSAYINYGILHTSINPPAEL